MRFSFPTVLYLSDYRRGTISFCLSDLTGFNMELRRSLRGLCALVLLNVYSFQLVEEDLETKDLSKAILEMLHINKLLVLQQTKPHPYMKQVYQLLDTKELRQRGGADGTLVQSLRSFQGTKYNTPGWIWFNISHLNPSMTSAELVLLRKTLHPEPLTVMVAVHSLSSAAGNLTVSGPLTEHLLTLDQLPPSGYDVFNVTAALSAQRHGSQVLGFQLHFRDEGGSLVLHEALTQSLYCLNTSSLSQPLLVAYRVKPKERKSFEGRQRQFCRDATHQEKHQQGTKDDVTCKLHRHYIDIHNTELGQWILQPTEFIISFCRGMCTKEQKKPAPVKTPVKNHKENDIYQSSHCIPQEWSPLTVMYRSNTNDIIIKELQSAEKCVCSQKAYIRW